MCATSEGQVLALIPTVGPLAVAVVDLRLGGDLAGQRIIRALRMQIPDLPVVVVTGFGHNTPEANLRGLGWPTVRLPKPAGAVAGCVGNGRGCLRRGDGIASGGEVNHALGGRLTEALPAIHLAHADLA